jgi:pyridoxine 4-dehydrogenase
MDAPLPAAAAGTLNIGGDLTVNRLGFGAMRITGPGIWGPPKDPAAARRVLQRAIELGVDFIDTADSYGPEVSERLIAEALHPYPKGLVIATKGGLVRPRASSWEADVRPVHLRAACEGSLKRLRLERIDLYQLHCTDPRVPLEDSLGELVRLQGEGKIRHIGVSNFTVADLERGRRVARIVSVQNRYNIEEHPREVLAVCERDGLAFIPWGPLGRSAAGWASWALRPAARAHDVDRVAIALAWLLAKSPVMLPIPGTGSLEHLEHNVAAAGLRLTAAELARIG